MDIRCDYCNEELNSETINKSVCCPHCGKKIADEFRREAIEKLAPKLNPDIIKEFGLTTKQARIYFSYQYCLTLTDIDNETDEEKKKKKNQWLEVWKNSCEDFLKAGKQAEIDSRNLKIISNYSFLNKEVKNLIKTINNKRPIYLILMEITFFTPYYPLYAEEDDDKNKPFKELKFNNKDARRTLDDFANSLCIDREYISHFISARKKAINSITGRNKKVLLSSSIIAIAIAVTGGLVSPAIGVLFAPAGLYGAAAVSAGLAALGGGAIAAGGLGIAGGTAVIVGGGAILGGSMGAGIGSIISARPEVTLLLAFKLEVAIRIIALKFQNDIEFARKILKELEIKINNSDEELKQAEKNLKKKTEKEIDLQNAINKLENEGDKNIEKAKNLNIKLNDLKKNIKDERKKNKDSRKSLKYLKSVVERNKKFVAKYNKKE